MTADPRVRRAALCVMRLAFLPLLSADDPGVRQRALARLDALDAQLAALAEPDETTWRH